MSSSLSSNQQPSWMGSLSNRNSNKSPLDISTSTKSSLFDDDDDILALLDAPSLTTSSSNKSSKSKSEKKKSKKQTDSETKKSEKLVTFAEISDKKQEKREPNDGSTLKKYKPSLSSHAKGFSFDADDILDMTTDSSIGQLQGTNKLSVEPVSRRDNIDRNTLNFEDSHRTLRSNPQKQNDDINHDNSRVPETIRERESISSTFNISGSDATGLQEIGKLVARLQGCLNSTASEKDAQIKSQEDKLAQLRIEVDKLKRERDSIFDQKLKAQKEFEEERKKHIRCKENMKRNEELLRSNAAEDLEKAQESYEKNLNELKANHEEAIKSLVTSNEKSFADLQSSTNDQADQLKEKLELLKEIFPIQDSLKNNSSMLNLLKDICESIKENACTNHETQSIFLDNFFNSLKVLIEESNNKHSCESFKLQEAIKNTDSSLRLLANTKNMDVELLSKERDRLEQLQIHLIDERKESLAKLNEDKARMDKEWSKVEEERRQINSLVTDREEKLKQRELKLDRAIKEFEFKQNGFERKQSVREEELTCERNIIKEAKTVLSKEVETFRLEKEKAKEIISSSKAALQKMNDEKTLLDSERDRLEALRQEVAKLGSLVVARGAELEERQAVINSLDLDLDVSDETGDDDSCTLNVDLSAALHRTMGIEHIQNRVVDPYSNQYQERFFSNTALLDSTNHYRNERRMITQQPSSLVTKRRTICAKSLLAPYKNQIRLLEKETDARQHLVSP